MLASAVARLKAFRAQPFLRRAPRLWAGRLAVPLLLALGVGCTPASMPGMPLSAMNAKEEAEATVPPAPPASAVAAAPAITVPAVAVMGRGFAQVSGQPGGTLGDLAEQVYGAGLVAQTVVRDSVVVDDELRARLAVALRGARTVAILPKGEDGYEVVMQLDPASLGLVNRILRAGP
jgi:hypothetical protein